MAGKFRAVKGLVLGLVVAALGLIALAEATQAGRWAERRGRKAQEVPPTALHQEQPRSRPQVEQPRPGPQVEQPRPQPQIARAGTGAAEAPSPEQVAAIARAQRCLAELGYYKGEIDGKRGRATWTAFWHFKHEHGLAGHSDLLAEPVQQKIAALCKSSEDDGGGRTRRSGSGREARPGAWRPSRTARLPPSRRRPTRRPCRRPAFASISIAWRRTSWLCCVALMASALRSRAANGLAWRRRKGFPRPSSTNCKRRAAWSGAARACPSPAISPSTTCGASNAPAMSSFARSRSGSCQNTERAPPRVSGPLCACASFIVPCRRRPKIPTQWR